MSPGLRPTASAARRISSRSSADAGRAGLDGPDRVEAGGLRRLGLHRGGTDDASRGPDEATWTPGTIRLTSDTLRLAEGFIEVKLLGPIPVKGLAAPVDVYEAMGIGAVRTRLQAAARR